MDGLGKSGYSGRLIRANAVPSAPVPGEPARPEVPETQLAPQQAEAERLLARARSQAETILSRAEGAAQRLIDDAGRAAQKASETRLSTDLLAFNRKLRRELDEVRPLLARMVRDAVGAIIGDLPEDERIARMISRALRDLDAEKSVVLHVSRADHANVLSVVQAMAKAGETSISTVFIDPDLAAETCRLEAGGLSVEIGLGAQLDLLESMLLLESAPADPSVSGASPL